MAFGLVQLMELSSCGTVHPCRDQKGAVPSSVSHTICLLTGTVTALAFLSKQDRKLLAQGPLETLPSEKGGPSSQLLQTETLTANCSDSLATTTGSSLHSQVIQEICLMARQSHGGIKDISSQNMRLHVDRSLT